MHLLCVDHISIISIEHEGGNLIENEMVSIKTNKIEDSTPQEIYLTVGRFLPHCMEGCNGVMVSPSSLVQD